MLLKVLARSQGAWVIAAPAEHAGNEISCELEQELLAYANQHRASVVGLQVFWEAIDRFGPRSLGTDRYHRVDKENEIYEFIKGRLRVLCFEDAGAVCVCCNVILKDSQKTPPGSIRRAISVRNRYLAAKKKGDTEFVD